MDLEQIVFSYLPPNRKQTSGGWVSFNCPCCVKQGEPRPDRKKRGGIHIEGDLISYHCFNCGFTASHRSGRLLGSKFSLLLEYLGVPDSEIKRIQLECIREKELADGPIAYVKKSNKTSIPKFDTVKLPTGAKPLIELIESDDPPEQAINVAKYLYDRGIYDYISNVYWSPKPGFKTRAIFPFFQSGNIVGYTARSTTDNVTSKYLMQVGEDFVYGIDRVTERDRKYLILTEGVIDAELVNGVAVLSNEISNKQAEYVKLFKGEVIVCPDRDEAGKKLAKQAIEYGWSVSFPNWQDDIKDVADAVNRYGKLYTIKSIIDGRVSNPTKIEVKLKIAGM